MLDCEATVQPNQGKAKSAKVNVTCDLRDQLKAGDVLKIGGAWCRLAKDQKGGAESKEARGKGKKEEIGVVTWNSDKGKGVLTLGPYPGSEEGLDTGRGPLEVHLPLVHAENPGNMRKDMVTHFRNDVMVGQEENWDYSLLIFLLTTSAHGLIDRNDEQGAWKAVNGLRVIRNKAFAHVGKCRMSEEEFENALRVMEHFVGAVTVGGGAEVCAEFRADVRKSEDMQVTCAGVCGGGDSDASLREIWTSALQKWGEAVGERFDTIDTSLESLQNSMNAQDEEMELNFLEARGEREAIYAAVVEGKEVGIESLNLVKKNSEEIHKNARRLGEMAENMAEKIMPVLHFVVQRYPALKDFDKRDAALDECLRNIESVLKDEDTIGNQSLEMHLSQATREGLEDPSLDGRVIGGLFWAAIGFGDISSMCEIRPLDLSIEHFCESVLPVPRFVVLCFKHGAREAAKRLRELDAGAGKQNRAILWVRFDILAHEYDTQRLIAQLVSPVTRFALQRSGPTRRALVDTVR
jgi:hypothetical protein